MFKKFLQSEQGREAFRTLIDHGVRMDYLIETGYDRSPDGKLTLKPEITDQVREIFEQTPK